MVKNSIIKNLKLKKLLNKDYLKEFYRSNIDYKNKKLFSYIYYLMESNEIFPFHRLQSHVTWQFCKGNTLNLYIIETFNKIKIIKIGNNILEGENLIHIIEPNTWFASESLNSNKYDYTLVTHHIIPSYVEKDEEFGTYDKIKIEIPKFTNIIKKFSCYQKKYFYDEKIYSI